MRSPIISSIIRFLSLILVFIIWRWFFDQQFDLMTDAFIIIGGVVAVAPISSVGRFILNKYPTAKHTFWLNMTIHFSIMICLGAGIIRAILSAESWKGVIIPFPKEISFILLSISGVFTLLTVVYLALRGLGAPFALIANSRYLVSDWLYARTRNPMVLAILLFLVSLALFFQSAGFLLWVLTLVVPVWIFFLKVYEEKELEIRFGENYLEYKIHTPLLVPFGIKTQK
ncbi:MAG: methyltransferase family protein [Candidatus Thorarchaeota archaeon]